MAPLAVMVAQAAWAAEGMWTLDNLPRAALKAEHGFEPDAAWLSHVQRAAVRVGGCSGSIVSGQGLVMTNHHCVTRCLAELSTRQRPVKAEGFLARTPKDELNCTGLEVLQLQSERDVTAQVQAATQGLTGEAFQKAEDAVRARLARECQQGQAATRRCDVTVLYRGGQYVLQQYERYSDVRLVWVPEDAIASFGGDPDNFNFPRWCLDAAMLRLWRDGQPVKTPVHFRVEPEGPKAGELLFVPGHPGQTQRSLTVAQLERVRERLATQGIPAASESRGLMHLLSQRPEPTRTWALQAMGGIENGLKVQQGQLQALFTPDLWSMKQAQEQSLKAHVQAKPELRARVGDPWADIERAQQVRRAMEQEVGLIAEGGAFSAPHFQYARTLVRGPLERAKPDGQRLREFSESSLPAMERRLKANTPMDLAFERERLEWSLTRMRSVLGPDHPVVRQVLGASSPAQLATQWIQGSKLHDAAERSRLWDGGAAAVELSADPFIALVRAIEPHALALRERFEAQVQAVERQAAQRLALAQFDRDGRSRYPDATGTLRLSFGTLKGWQEGAVAVPTHTTVAGLRGRHTGAAPFALPASWLVPGAAMAGEVPFNFVTDHDIIGGNSGSPMINRQGRWVGLVFDGNRHSLGGSFFYDSQLNRAVSVHPAAILQSLQFVYGARELADELLKGEPQAR
ncbi:MAG: S46 family peptidase [Betaproteobacteria bacterium]|nr:S46 family peptidase [Betaproteobacteria bacterium]